MFAYMICNFSWHALPLYSASVPMMLRTEKPDLSIAAKALDFLMVPKRENMSWFNFIPANVKNNSSYLKTNVLKNC